MFRVSVFLAPSLFDPSSLLKSNIFTHLAHHIFPSLSSLFFLFLFATKCRFRGARRGWEGRKERGNFSFLLLRWLLSLLSPSSASFLSPPLSLSLSSLSATSSSFSSTFLQSLPLSFRLLPLPFYLLCLLAAAPYLHKLCRIEEEEG